MASLQKREKIMVGLAGAAAVSFAFNYFVCGEAKAPEPLDARKQNVQDVPVISQPADAKSTQAKRPESKPRTRKPKTEFVSWVRNPFAETWRLSEADVAPEESKALVLRGVIRKGNQAYVLIGDQILKEGEEFGDLKVVAIKQNYVVCRKGKKIVRLVIGDEKVN